MTGFNKLLHDLLEGFKGHLRFVSRLFLALVYYQVTQRFNGTGGTNTTLPAHAAVTFFNGLHFLFGGGDGTLKLFGF